MAASAAGAADFEVSATGIASISFGSCIVAAIVLSSFPVAGQLTSDEARGRQIYRQGTSPSGGMITARLGTASSNPTSAGRNRDDISASVLPCVNCHRADGRGRREGGVVPSNITWTEITKPYGVVHATGRTHPPYTTASLAIAITRGIDPAGNALNAVMPRYKMSREDLAVLIAYLQRLGQDPDPGLSETAVRIGLILPPSSAPAEVRRAIRAALETWFGEANRQGGVFGRRLEPVFTELPDDRTEAVPAFRRFVETEQPFALASSLPIPAAGKPEETLSTLARELEIPVMTPFAPEAPGAEGPAPRYVFSVHAGLREQAVALGLFADRREPASNKPRAAVLFPGGDESHASVAAALADQLERLGWPAVQQVKVPIGSVDAGALVRQFQREKIDVLFSLMPSRESAACLSAAATAGWLPRTFVPGSLVGAEIFDVPRAHQARLFAAYPSMPPTQPRVGPAPDISQSTTSYVIAQQAALATVTILLEGLRRAGREVSRETVIDALETLDRFETGLTRPVSFRPNRRTGTRGAYIVLVDLERRTLVPVGDWIDVPQ
jgi:ABC-type branched-subunit amino acid transport system substrate-binding protein